jgi:hypothetical protein
MELSNPVQHRYTAYLLNLRVAMFATSLSASALLSDKMVAAAQVPVSGHHRTLLLLARQSFRSLARLVYSRSSFCHDRARSY